jgi:hypothetical protein
MQESIIEKSYNFKLPNHEIDSSYYSDCFSAIFNLKSPDKLQAWGSELHTAFLKRDSQAVSDMFSTLLSPITYFQRIESENSFHISVVSLLRGMAFKVLSEVLGSHNRLDLYIELSSHVGIIIELKHCKDKEELTKKVENKIIAGAFSKKFPNEMYHILANEASRTMDAIDIADLIADSLKNNPTELEINKLLTHAVKKSTSKAEINKILANAARKKLTADQILEVLGKDHYPHNFSMDEKEKIDKELSTAIAEALTSIRNKDYPSVVKHLTNEIIPMAMATYGNSGIVKTAFGDK